MQLNNQPQFFSSKSRAPRQIPLSISPSTPLISDATPYFIEPRSLTPASEEFNQFILDSKRIPTDADDNTLIRNSPVIVAVVGVGYVGLELVQAFAKRYPVIAYDVSKQRIEIVRQQVDRTSVYLTSDPKEIIQATHILISVPTRVHEADKSIDTSHLKSAISTVATYARPGVVVVVESSVAVGTTRKLLTPLQQSRGVKAGMSPERVDPGRTNIHFEAIPKVVSGLDYESLQAIQQLYEPVFDRVVPVSSCEVAEMTKLYENCQRMIGIAYANEMADACQSIGIDPMEVCSAAATKPFGYQSYLPGPGVGGHCIPVNPYYLLSNMQFPLLQAATEKMWQRPAVLIDEVMESLAIQKTNWRTTTLDNSYYHDSVSSRVLVVGVGFKPGQSVTSHSPGIAMIDHLANFHDNVHVEFCDPLVGAEAVHHATKMNDVLYWNAHTLDNHYDAIVVAVAQHGLDLDVLTRLQKARVFNFTSSLKGFGSRGEQGSFGEKRDSAVAF